MRAALKAQRERLSAIECRLDMVILWMFVQDDRSRIKDLVMRDEGLQCGGGRAVCWLIWKHGGNFGAMLIRHKGVMIISREGSPTGHSTHRWSTSAF